MRRLIAEAATPVHEVLIPAHQINQLDSTGADQLAKLQPELEEQRIGFSVAEAKSGLRETMRRTGLEDKIGADHFYESIEDGVQAFLQRRNAR